MCTYVAEHYVHLKFLVREFRLLMQIENEREVGLLNEKNVRNNKCSVILNYHT